MPFERVVELLLHVSVRCPVPNLVPRDFSVECLLVLAGAPPWLERCFLDFRPMRAASVVVVLVSPRWLPRTLTPENRSQLD
jgi:hypothetical protein